MDDRVQLPFVPFGDDVQIVQLPISIGQFGGLPAQLAAQLVKLPLDVLKFGDALLKLRLTASAPSRQARELTDAVASPVPIIRSCFRAIIT